MKHSVWAFALTLLALTACQPPVTYLPGKPPAPAPKLVATTPAAGETVASGSELVLIFDQELNALAYGTVTLGSSGLRFTAETMTINGNYVTVKPAQPFPEGTSYTGIKVRGFCNLDYVPMSEYEDAAWWFKVGSILPPPPPPNQAPTASAGALTGSAETGSFLTLNYTYSDAENDPEGLSSFRWLAAATPAGPWTVLSGEGDRQLGLTEALAGQYVRGEVTPVAAAGTLTGLPVLTAAAGPVQVKVGPRPPVAVDVAVTGTLVEGQALTGHYTFHDPDGDAESGSQLVWYKAASASGPWTVVPGASLTELVLIPAFKGLWLKFEVTPASAVAPRLGVAVASQAVGPVLPADQVPPTVTTVSPASGATGVSVFASLVLSFSEPLDPAVKGQVKMGPTVWADGINCTLTISGTDVTLKPVVPLPEDTVYTGLHISGFADPAGNVMSVDSRPAWTMHTLGTIGPVTVDPPSGSYGSVPPVIATCPTAGAVLRYTLDGSQPVELSPAVTGPILIGTGNDFTVVLKVRAFKAGLISSDIVSRTYTILPLKKVKKIVVIGSSTAEGWGATDRYGWAFLFADLAKSMDPANEVVNLAKAGYSTTDLMPTGDPERNITKALSLNPDLILINLPSNDANVGRTIDEQVANFKVIMAAAAAKSVPLYASTTQPRNFAEQAKRDNLIAMKAEIYKLFGDRTIDFWTGLANADGTIVKTYDSGDGVHLNDNGHRLLYSRVRALNLFGPVGLLWKKIHYWSTKPAANLHYQKDDWTWTASPGLVMTKDAPAGWFSLTVADEGRLQFCFNDNAGVWDSNNSLNYFTTAREVWVKNGVISLSQP